MKILMIIIGLGILLQWFELQQFKITSYEIQSTKLNSEYKICFLSDLHGKTYGKRLLKSIEKNAPDIIVIGGDVVSKKEPIQMKTVIPFLTELSQIAKVYYCFGNHETTIDETLVHEKTHIEAYWQNYMKVVKELGIEIIRNDEQNIGTELCLVALELPQKYFRKKDIPELQSTELNQILKLDDLDREKFCILAAHHPLFADEYSELDVDLILSGHTHGGLVRFPFVGSIISTEFQFNPKYDGGWYSITNRRGKRTPLIVSKGLGTHTFHIRILNRAECIMINLAP